jgi:hypothetical protein
MIFTLGKTKQFFFLLDSLLSYLIYVLILLDSKLPIREYRRRPQKGAFKAQSQAIYHYLNHDG